MAKHTGILMRSLRLHSNYQDFLRSVEVNVIDFNGCSFLQGKRLTIRLILWVLLIKCKLQEV